MRRSLSLLLCAVLLTFLALHSALAEIDDSSLFMEAFNAFQHKDYLFSEERLNQLNQDFPDSPLRDVTLLLLARSYHRAGENDAAARTINLFNTEFGSSALAGSVDEELLALGKRQKAGEKLGINRHLQLAARKVRNEQLSLERAAAERTEHERLAREKAERERLAHEKAETERRERERLAAIKAARDAIRFSIEPPAGDLLAEVGTVARIPFELVNHGTGSEEFTLEAIFPAGLNVTLTAADDLRKPVTRVLLTPTQRFKGILSLTLPGDRVDNSRQLLTVKVTSARFNDLSQSKTLQVLAQAPLLRAVTRLPHTVVTPGEKLSYHVTVLNVGSIAAKEIDLRISLPPQLKLTDAGGNNCWVENEQLAACRVSAIGSGQLIERTLSATVREKARGKDLRGSVEVLQTVLQTKESFNGANFSIKTP